MKQNFLFVALFLVSVGCLGMLTASAKITNVESAKCKSIFRSSKIDPSTFFMVGHHIHSVTVYDLKKFKPTVTEKNGIPTINQDTSDKMRRILPDAPDYRPAFLNEGMIVFDSAMMKADNPSWDLLETPMSKVGHAFHMQEAWSRTLIHYESLKASPPSADLCACALDVENNGIMRSPLTFTFDGVTYGSAPTGNLTGTKSWLEWKALMAKMPHKYDYNAAVFLYCKLEGKST